MDQKELEQIYQYIKRRMIKEQQDALALRDLMAEKVNEEALEAEYGPYGQG